MAKDNEELRVLLETRSRLLHKAGSVRHNMPDRVREAEIDRLKGLADVLLEQIIDWWVNNIPDLRPEPTGVIYYGDRKYLLQRYDGVTARYVLWSDWQESLYDYKPIPYRQHIKKQIESA